MRKVLKYSFFDLVRSRWIYGYFLFYFIATWGLLYFSNDIARTVISLMNVVLILTPLIGIIFGALYFYNSKEFDELLLALPLKRKSIFLGKYLGLSLSLSLSFLLGVGIPFILNGAFYSAQFSTILLMLISGLMLTLIFTGIAFLVCIRFENAVKGFGIAIFIWLFMALIYDGLFLLSLLIFNEYPLDKFALIATLFNPIDLSRILILLKLDISALMGYTGAVFNQFLGNSTGMAIAFISLFLWMLIPIGLFIRIAKRKDF